ncbi:MAG: RNA polymerase sigma factor SigW, partial [Oscillospiraceae bacterium]|nr:RNA polymerase sigma factor SigW [Oscillospiraceae bacterium]
MDREQVAQMLNLYGDDVFRLAMSYLGNRQDAEDVCQNIFLKALNTRH